MRESWRWFGPNDPVCLDDIRQAGATDIVSALYHIPAGEVWPESEIRSFKEKIEDTSEGRSKLHWSVVESVPVHEAIKQGKTGCENYISTFIKTMENLASCGVMTICYNFMPVIDWTRTDLDFQLPTKATALRFDYILFAAFDLFILKRQGAERDYTVAERAKAEKAFAALSCAEKEKLTRTVTAGLPGRMTDSYNIDAFRNALADYDGIGKEALRQNLYYFLNAILPTAEKLGIKLAIHPDDPPHELLGLPRVICTANDLEQLFDACPSAANGITLCVGTYGSRIDNDLPAMAQLFSSRIYFAHLRGVKKDNDEPKSFYEASHLDSDIDIISVINHLLSEEKHRSNEKGNTLGDIAIRPDHGHRMLDDLNKSINPGYSAIGRLKGLAEIRGVIRTLMKVNP